MSTCSIFPASYSRSFTRTLLHNDVFAPNVHEHLCTPDDPPPDEDFILITPRPAHDPHADHHPPGIFSCRDPNVTLSDLGFNKVIMA